MGRKSLYVLGSVFSCVSLVLFALLQNTAASIPLLVLALFRPLQFHNPHGSGAVSGSGLLGIELSPTRIRAIAQYVPVVGGGVPVPGAARRHRAALHSLGLVSHRRSVGTCRYPRAHGPLEEINSDSDAAVMPAAVAAE
jgi:hypothetical protein